MNILGMLGKTRANLLREECFFCGERNWTMDKLKIVVRDGDEGRFYNATVCVRCHQEQTNKPMMYSAPF